MQKPLIKNQSRVNRLQRLAAAALISVPPLRWITNAIGRGAQKKHKRMSDTVHCSVEKNLSTKVTPFIYIIKYHFKPCRQRIFECILRSAIICELCVRMVADMWTQIIAFSSAAAFLPRPRLQGCLAALMVSGQRRLGHCSPAPR